MVFNVLAHNRDDHAGNFAFLLDDLSGEWSFAPAYDLTFASGPGGEHLTTVMGEGAWPSRQHCVRLGGQYGIAPARAEVIFAEVAATVSRWHEFAERAGAGKNPGSVLGGIWQIPEKRLVEPAGSFIDSGMWHATGTRFFSMLGQLYFMQIAN